MRVARPVVLSTEQRDLLESRARARSASARSVERARIILLAASGMQDKQIAAKLRIMPEKAARRQTAIQEPVPPARRLLRHDPQLGRNLLILHSRGGQ